MVFAYLLSQLTRWETVVQYLRRLWCQLIPIRPLPDIERRANDSAFPHYVSKLERDAQQQAYIAAINDIDVLQLASSYNLGKKCEEFDH